MDEKNDLIKVGKYDLRYNELLSIDIEELDIFRSKGLPAHMVGMPPAKLSGYTVEL